MHKNWFVFLITLGSEFQNASVWSSSRRIGNFNHRHIMHIPRIEIPAQRRDRPKWGVLILALGIIFLSLTVTGWAEKKPVGGNLETALFLQYQRPEGRPLAYRTVRDLVRTVETMGQSFETNLKYSSSYIIKSTGFDDQNNLMFQVTINKINCSMSSPQGTTKPDNSGLKGKSFNAIHSTNGKQLEITGTEDLPKIIFIPGADMDVKYMFEDILPGLSDTAVKTGETWITPVNKTVKMDQYTQTSKGESRSILEGIETIQGMECAKIKTETKSVIEGSGTLMGQALTATGEVAATTTWYFAYKKGWLVRSTTNVNENIKVKSGEMEIPRTTKGNIETELVK